MSKTRIEQMREELRLGHAPKLTDFLWLMERVEYLERREAEAKTSKKEPKFEDDSWIASKKPTK
jgi:hypothetical protein